MCTLTSTTTQRDLGRVARALCRARTPAASTPPLPLSTHVCLPAARLPIGETRSHPPLKDGGDQRLRCELVHHLVGCRVVKRVVEAELMVLEELSEVYLSLWLVDLTVCSE